MSKNTERGIGQQPDPTAPAPASDAKPREASERGGTASQPDEGGRAVRPGVGQVTLMGVSAPLIDREKVTAPGRDVHLPAEARRVAAPRSIAADAAPAPIAGRRPTPDQTIRMSKTSVMNQVTRAAPETTRADEKAELPVGRRERDPLDFFEEEAGLSTTRGAVALGIGLSVVLAAIVVALVRFGPNVRSGDPEVAQRPGSKRELRFEPRTPTVGGERLDPGAARAPSAPPETNPLPPVPPVPPDLAGAAALDPQSGTSPPAAVTPPPDDTFDPGGPGRIAGVDKNARRPNLRPKPPIGAGDRWLPLPGARKTPTPEVRSDGVVSAPTPAPGASGTPIAPPPLSAPPPASRPAPVGRTSPSRADDTKAPYDPDSPMAPATE